jgi:hypothetical protein
VITANASAAMKTYRRNFMCPSKRRPYRARQDVLAWVVRGRLLDRCKDAAER